MVTTTNYEKHLERMRKLAHDFENGVKPEESEELLEEGMRLWKLIRDNLLKSAKNETLARNNLVEISKNDLNTITLWFSKTKAKEVKSFHYKKEISFYSLMLRLAILAEPYGLKVVSRGVSSTDEHWMIEFVK